MTIDDFIVTYKSYAKDYRKETYNMGYSTQQRDYARDKAREYEQLAEWLEELKAKRKMLNFLFEVINPNDMETYMRIYNSTDVKVEGGKND